MRKIAFSGLKGRKKDTFILSFVVILAFLFIVIATILHSSSESLKEIERMETYGNWEYGYFDGIDEDKEKLLNNESISKLGTSRVVGNSEDLGIIGTFDGEFEGMSNFNMYKGRMPEKDNEIAIELGQLSNFPGKVEVGDEILVMLSFVLEETDEYEAHIDQKERFRDEIDEAVANASMDDKIWGSTIAEYIEGMRENYEMQKRMNPDLEGDFEEVVDVEVYIEDLLYKNMTKFNKRRSMG